MSSVAERNAHWSVLEPIVESLGVEYRRERHGRDVLASCVWPAAIGEPFRVTFRFMSNDKLTVSVWRLSSSVTARPYHLASTLPLADPDSPVGDPEKLKHWVDELTLTAHLDGG